MSKSLPKGHIVDLRNPWHAKVCRADKGKLTMLKPNWKIYKLREYVEKCIRQRYSDLVLFGPEDGYTVTVKDLLDQIERLEANCVDELA